MRAPRPTEYGSPYPVQPAPAVSASSSGSVSEPSSEVARGATFFLRASAAARICASEGADGAVGWANSEAVRARGASAVDAEEEEDLELVALDVEDAEAAAEEASVKARAAAGRVAAEGEAAVAGDDEDEAAAKGAGVDVDEAAAEGAGVAADDTPPAGVLLSAKSATKCLAKRKHMSP